MGIEQTASYMHGARSRSVRHLTRNIAVITGGFLLPAVLMAYPSNPPLGLTGAPGEGTCASCHSPLTAGSGVTITFGSLTYTPGGAAINLMVAMSPGVQDGFELSSRALNNNSQAGTLTAGANSVVSTSGSVQYAYQSGPDVSWALTWTPPATNVGNVVMYVTGIVGGGGTFSNSYTLTPAAGPPPPSPTLSASPSALTFASSGTTPPAQTIQVTSSASAIAFTTSVSTSSGGNWLSATPAGGNTPLGVSVTANPAGLATGTYTGTVSVASTGASNSPQTVGVTFNVTAVPPPPPVPTLVSTPSALSFSAATAGSTVAAQSLHVTGSDASALPVAAAASTSSGGNWLAVTPGTGTAPADFSVSVTTSSLTAGHYTGAITLTSSGASNSPLNIPVNLTIGSTPPPQTGPLQFSLDVLDKLSGGPDELLLAGTGSVSGTGRVTAGGLFTRFTPSSEEGQIHVVSTGSWTASSMVSFTPLSATSTSGGVLVIMVNLSTAGGSTTPATMRIAQTGSDTGVTLTITGGANFTPTGAGQDSIVASSGSGGCPAPGGGGGGSHEDISERR